MINKTGLTLSISYVTSNKIYDKIRSTFDNKIYNERIFGALQDH